MGNDDFLKLLFNFIAECQAKGWADEDDLRYMGLCMTSAVDRNCANAVNVLCALEDAQIEFNIALHNSNERN